MYKSLTRAYVSNGIRQFSDMQGKTNHTVLIVSATGCTHCAEFETEHMIDAEAKVRREYNTVLVPWKCDDDTYRGIALRSGIDDIPAIVIIPPKGAEISIVDAMKFLKTKS